MHTARTLTRSQHLGQLCLAATRLGALLFGHALPLATWWQLRCGRRVVLSSAALALARGQAGTPTRCGSGCAQSVHAYNARPSCRDRPWIITVARLAVGWQLTQTEEAQVRAAWVGWSSRTPTWPPPSAMPPTNRARPCKPSDRCSAGWACCCSVRQQRLGRSER